VTYYFGQQFGWIIVKAASALVHGTKKEEKKKSLLPNTSETCYTVYGKRVMAN